MACFCNEWLIFAMEMTPSFVIEARMLCTAFNTTGILALFQSSSQPAAAFRKVKVLGPDLILDLRKANFANKSLEEAIMEKILSSIKQSRPACFRVIKIQGRVGSILTSLLTANKCSCFMNNNNNNARDKN